MMLPRVCVHVGFPTESLARPCGCWHRSQCHRNQSPVEQRGSGIPKQATIHPTRRFTLIFYGLYSIHGRTPGNVVGVFFPNTHRYCKSTRRRICKNQRQIRKKRTRKFCSLHPPSPSFSLLLICGGANGSLKLVVVIMQMTHSQHSEYH